MELSNGDGLAFIARDGSVTGYRADVVEGRTVRIKDTAGLFNGQKVYRNFNIRFDNLYHILFYLVTEIYIKAVIKKVACS